MRALSALHATEPAELPQVWRVDDLARETACIPTGHAALDALLPGGGWPVGCLIEVLQDTPTRHAWQLLMPALAQALRARAGPLMLVDPPAEPFCAGLQARGLPAQRLLWVRAGSAKLASWAAEQALRCADVPAVLAWLPQARDTELRRLHLLAAQQQRLLFVFRGAGARQSSSPARLRLQVEGSDALVVHLFKRRGPPLQGPLQLPAHAPRLASLLQARRRRLAPVVPASSSVRALVPGELPSGPPGGVPGSQFVPEASHALDRPASLVA